MPNGIEFRTWMLDRETSAIIVPDQVSSLIADGEDPGKTLVLLTGGRTVTVKGAIRQVADDLGIAYAPRS